MALTKVTYAGGVTVIGAQNLNDIQDEVINTRNDFESFAANTSPSVTLVTTGSVTANNSSVKRSGGTVIVLIDVTISNTGTIDIITGLPNPYANTRAVVATAGGDSARLLLSGTTLQLIATTTGRYYGQLVYIASS